jgi:arabinose-5-phosphate isomerase
MRLSRGAFSHGVRATAKDLRGMSEPKIDLDFARQVLAAEGDAIRALAGRVGEPFERAARLLHACAGQVVLTGIGKAGLIAQKISATLASTGTRSIFLHPVEAMHGDIGRVRAGDVVVALSHSGQTDELIRLLNHLKARGARLVAITGSAESVLGRHADVTICYGQVEEACPLGLAPTVSTSCMLAMGDALALVVMRLRDFQPDDFAAFHPGGDLGRRLLRVEQVMTFRPGERLRVVRDDLPLGKALEESENVLRRSGAMVLADAGGRLSGIITDADLRRLVIRHRPAELLERPAREFMTREPKHVHLGDLASEVLAVFHRYRIDELPVVDGDGRPVGLIDVQDLLGVKTLEEGENA